MHLSKNASHYSQEESCGADRDRTDDIQLAKLALSQLSYSPGKPPMLVARPALLRPVATGNVVGLGGLEPPTSRLSGARSSQLSYRPRGLRVGKPLQRPSFSKSRAAGIRSFKTKQQAQSKILDCDSETLTWSTSAAPERHWHCLLRPKARVQCPVSLERR